MELSIRSGIGGLGVLLVWCVAALTYDGVEASHQVYEQSLLQAHDNVKMEHRTGYHFQPIKFWINGT
ncbi:hypothetical protein ACS0TY_015829 [Phlomoides rotata]